MTIKDKETTKQVETNNDRKPLVTDDLSSHNRSKINHWMSKFLSLRAVIIIMIVVLILMCCSMVWLASFIGSSNAIQSLTRDLLSNAKYKVVQFINHQLVPFQQIGRTLADEYNKDLLPFTNLTFMKDYLYSKYVHYKPTSIGYYVAYPISSINTYIERGTGSNVDLLYGQQVNGWPGYNLYMMNKSTEALMWQNPTSYIPYNVKTLDYWNSSMVLFEKHSTNEVLAPPYLTVMGDIALFYAIKIYTPSLYIKGVKEFGGIVKVNIGVVALQSFLKNLTLIGNGYLLLAETNNNVIGGSINTTALIPSNRLTLFELTDRKSGDLMSKIYNTYGGFSNLPSEFPISSNGEGFVISFFIYTFMNIEWRVFMVSYESDISKTTNINTGISIGVSLTCLIAGLLMSVLIGYVITSPLVYLQKQFKLIKKFDLDEVKFTNSSFKEVESILTSLKEMVSWLNEFKAFIPAHVFSQLKDISGDENETHHSKDGKRSKKQVVPSSTTTAQQGGEDVKSSMSSLQSHQNSSHNSKHLRMSMGADHSGIGAKGLFALGYNQKETAIISIQVKDLANTGGKTPHEISQLFSKIANALQSITKSMSGDLQFFSIHEMQIALTKSTRNSIKHAAFDCALKISKSLTPIGLDYYMGVSCGKAHVGNVGTTSMRYYSILGPIVEQAKKLQQLARMLNVKILVNEESCDTNTKSSFILKPVERMKMMSSNNDSSNLEQKIQTIYEIVKDSSVNEDEWLYELAQKNENQAFTEFSKAFSLFHEKFSSATELEDAFEKAQAFYSEYLEKNPQDQVVRNVLLIFDRIRDERSGGGNKSLSDLLMEYHCYLRFDKDFTFNSSSQ